MGALPHTRPSPQPPPQKYPSFSESPLSRAPGNGPVPGLSSVSGSRRTA
ncbi:hypothetical protein GPN2_14164 [Streptomyces murinus]